MKIKTKNTSVSERGIIEVIKAKNVTYHLEKVLVKNSLLAVVKEQNNANKKKNKKTKKIINTINCFPLKNFFIN